MNINRIGIETEIVTDMPLIPDCASAVTEAAALLSLLVLIMTIEMVVSHVFFWTVVESVTVTITVTAFL